MAEGRIGWRAQRAEARCMMSEPAQQPISTPTAAAYDEVLGLADRYAREWLDSVRERPIPPRVDVEAVMDALGRGFPEHGEPPTEVIRRLAEGAEPGLIATGSPRFFGWVIGGTQPVAL